MIGAINGFAITGGFELALNCDFLVASERARFGDTHTRVGVMPGWGLTVLLPQAIGVRRAREMSFTGQLPRRRRGAAVRSRQPRRAPRGADPVHPPDRHRHQHQRPGRRAPDPGHLRRGRRRRRSTRAGTWRRATPGPGRAARSTRTRWPAGAPPSRSVAAASDPAVPCTATRTIPRESRQYGQPGSWPPRAVMSLSISASMARASLLAPSRLRWNPSSWRISLASPSSSTMKSA